MKNVTLVLFVDGSIQLLTTCRNWNKPVKATYAIPSITTLESAVNFIRSRT